MNSSTTPRDRRLTFGLLSSVSVGLVWTLGVLGLLLPTYSADERVMPDFVPIMWVFCVAMIPLAIASFTFSIIALRRPRRSVAGTVLAIIGLFGAITTPLLFIIVGGYAFLMGLVRYGAVVH